MELKKGDILVATTDYKNAITAEQEYYVLWVFGDGDFQIRNDYSHVHTFQKNAIGEYFKIKNKTEHLQTERLKEIQFLIMRAYENGQKVELGLIAELLNIIK